MLLELHDPSATRCVLIGTRPAERDFSAFSAVLWLCDAEGIAAGPPPVRPGALEAVVIDRCDPATLAAHIERFLLRDGRQLPSLWVGDDVLQRAQSPYQSALAEVQAQLETQLRSRLTRKALAFTWQKHLLQNAGPYCRQRVPATWAGALRGLPAFVCGAGPSLDVSLPALARVAGQGVVISGDSSLRALARHGVGADFAVSIDAAKVPDRCLPEGAMPGRVVLSPFSPPPWAAAVPADRIFFLSNANLTVDWLGEQGVVRTGARVTESCGSTALDLARFLGCSPIYLFGLDLAASADAPHVRHHSGVDPTLYASSGYHAERPCPRVPGNYEPEVSTFLLSDVRALNRRLAEWPSGLIHNVNDRGVRIANTTVVHPRDLKLGRPAPDKAARLAALGGPPEGEASRAEAALQALAGVALRHSAQLDRLRRTLGQGRVGELVAGLRVLFSDPAFSRVLGAFSLKVVPLLLPPHEADATVWTALMDELAELVTLAETAVVEPARVELPVAALAG
jgi:hypothetical protein